MFLTAGSFGLQYGSERTVLHTGDCFMVPTGVPHSYVVLSDEPASHLNLYDPAGEIEVNFDQDHQHAKAPDPRTQPPLRESTERKSWRLPHGLRLCNVEGSMRFASVSRPM
jgi:hypothetical protein